MVGCAGFARWWCVADWFCVALFVTGMDGKYNTHTMDGKYAYLGVLAGRAAEACLVGEKINLDGKGLFS